MRSTSSYSLIAAAVYFRHLDHFGDPVVFQAPLECLQQVGFERDDTLFATDHRVFEGFDLLREYFAFPRKFLGCRLTGLDEFMPRIKARTVDIVFAFDELNTRLAAAVRPQALALYAAPAINLFEKTADRIQLKSSQHEYHVVPDRSHYLDYEPHRVLEVYAPLFRRAGKGPGATALRGVASRGAACIRNLLLDPAAAATAHRRREAHRHIVGLYRHGHVHFVERTRRNRR